MIYNLYKERGETPLDCIQRFRVAFPEHKEESMTYLGRLDPMAEGVLLVGSGEDTSQKHREEFFNLDKEYDFVVLFGFATDTYDILGKITHSLTPSLTTRLRSSYAGQAREGEPKEMDLIKICKLFEGEREQKYPEYSSKMISLRKHYSSAHVSECTDIFLLENSSCSAQSASQGIHKHVHSNNVFPSPDQGEGGVGFSKKIIIHRLQFQKLETLSKKELFGKLLMDISKVKGNFRQPEILEMWKQKLLDDGPSEAKVAKFSAHVSSGTYIRSLVNEMSDTLGIPATCFSIKRTRVGSYKIENSLRF